MERASAGPDAAAQRSHNQGTDARRLTEVRQHEGDGWLPGWIRSIQ